MSGMAKRSITIAGHRTSVSIEEPFWQALGDIAAERGMSLAALIADIDRTRPAGSNLSSAIRLSVLEQYRQDAAGRKAVKSIRTKATR
jgi:predicted DNA-binding ribbon-helix-helix protein